MVSIPLTTGDARYPDGPRERPRPLPQDTGAHIQISGLTKRYPGQQQDALHNIDLTVSRGEIFGIIGRSGAGKSSLIRCLNRLESPTGGKVVIEGVDIGTLSHRQLVQWRRNTGMIFQHFNLLSAKTVRQNIELPMKVAGIEPAARRQRVDELLALVGLTAHQHAWPAQLSGGQKQRVGIARALVHNPDLLLCDEATSALDPETTRSILQLLRDINQQRRITIILITHEMDVVHDLCHRVAVIDNGEIIEQGPLWQVCGDPQQATTRQLLTPTHNDLPDHLLNRLTANNPGGDGRLLVRLRYTGAGAVPALTFTEQGPFAQATVIRSNIEWVTGRPIGQLLLLLDPRFGDRHLRDIVARKTGILADHIEEVGYVAGY